MDTIKNYLETMFANMPNTEAVRKAKSELLQMMDDKYTELIEEGLSENEAIGTVISEFGNLDDLAEDLGVAKEVAAEAVYTSAHPRRSISFEEAQDYIAAKKRSGFLIALGVALCIISISFIIYFCEAWNKDYIGLACMFVSIGIGAALLIYNNITFTSSWGFIKDELCQIDMTTADYAAVERKNYNPTHAMRLSVGIICCAFCWLPVAVFDEIDNSDIYTCPAIFILVAIGVFLVIFSNSINDSYTTLLGLNDANTISGDYGQRGNVQYINKTAETIMAVYWPTVTCLYFIFSFTTFHWEITWIIWPVAAIVNKVLNINLIAEDR